MNKGKVAFSRIFDIKILPKSVSIPRGNLFFVEHLILWFTFTNEIHENWYRTNNNVQCIPVVTGHNVSVFPVISALFFDDHVLTV